jgi:hypothetical protein
MKFNEDDDLRRRRHFYNVRYNHFINLNNVYSLIGNGGGRRGGRPLYCGRAGLSGKCIVLIHRKFAEWEGQRPEPVGCSRGFSPSPSTSFIGSTNLSPVHDLSETVVLGGGRSVHDRPSYDPDLIYLLSDVFVYPY